MLAPLPPEALAEELRCHDIYIAASRHDPCSMAVVEALACGLPVLYRDSGGHPELVGEAGCGFTHNEELLPALDRLVNEYEMRRALIRVTPLAEVADRYLAVMGMRP
jgi:glycosyltransferase involved in cell wall biosynthesis